MDRRTTIELTRRALELGEQPVRVREDGRGRGDVNFEGCHSRSSKVRRHRLAP